MNELPEPAASPSVRIVAEIGRRIAAGELRRGDRVPSTRQITREFGVAMATASKVLASLRSAGLVRPVPGVGTVVVDGAVDSGTVADGTVANRATHSGGSPVLAAGEPANARSSRPAEANPESTTLTRERIVRTAVDIADVEGLAALSMRRVAAGLGAATMSLYRHVRNKDELLVLMADNVFARYPLPAADPDWRAGLEALCRLQWRSYQRHAWLAQYVSMTRPQLIPPAMAHTEWAMAVLDHLGLDTTVRLHMAVTLANYVRGTAVNLEPEAQAEQDSGLSSAEWMESQNSVMADILATGEFPMFSAMLATGEVELSLDTLFEFGLGRLLDGLAVLVARDRS